MNWFKRLFGIKEVEPQVIETKVKETYNPIRGVNSRKAEAKKISVQTTTSRREKSISQPIQSRSSAVNSTINSSNDGFLESMLIAEITDSALLGTVIGGNPAGAILGDMMNDSDSDNRDTFDNSSNCNDSSDDTYSNFDNDSSSSYDSGSSYDSSSDSTSYDSGSSYDSSSNDW